jgi:hypothetical protein
MDIKIILIYRLCAALLLALKHREDPQCTMCDTEVMTTALVAALFFGSKYERARELLHEQGYIPNMLSKSQLSRRLHRLDHLFVLLFQLLGATFKDLNEESVYVIDTVPIIVCNTRWLSFTITKIAMVTSWVK